MPILNGNLLFLHIPKTGGGSITQALGLVRAADRHRGRHRLASALRAISARASGGRRDALFGHACLGVTLQHLTLNEVVSLGLLTPADLYERFTCFAVVRSPYTRVLSQWRSHGRSRRYPDLNVFVREWLMSPSARKDHNDVAHSRPQADFLRLDGFFRGGHAQAPEVHVLRFERLERDFAEFMSRFGPPGAGTPRLPHVHGSSDRDPRHEQVLDDTSKSLIARYYRQDFDAFGYDV